MERVTTISVAKHAKKNNAYSGVVPTRVFACVRVSVCVQRKPKNKNQQQTQQQTQPCTKSKNIDNNSNNGNNIIGMNNSNNNSNDSRPAGGPADGAASVFLAFSLRVCCASGLPCRLTLCVAFAVCVVGACCVRVC